MTVLPGETEPVRQDLLAEVTGLLARVTGEDEAWAARVSPASRLEGDLRLDSVELARLGALLTDAHGDRLGLAEFAASLDIDQLIGLTVGDLVRYLAGRLERERA